MTAKLGVGIPGKRSTSASAGSSQRRLARRTKKRASGPPGRGTSGVPKPPPMLVLLEDIADELGAAREPMPERWTSHFADCPDADEHRRERR